MFPFSTYLWPPDRRLRALQQLYLLQTFVAVLGRVIAYSWLLGAKSSDGLPLVYVLQSIPLCLLSFGMVGWVDRVGRAHLMRYTSLSFAVISLFFWMFSSSSGDWMAPAYLLFVETCIAMLTMQFWLLTAELVSPEQARQHFPSFSVYGALGAILTGGMVGSLQERSADQLLLLLPPPLLLMAWLSWWLGKRYYYRLGPRPMAARQSEFRSQVEGMFSLLQSSSLLRHVSMLNAIITCSGLLIDFMYCLTAETQRSFMGLPLFFSSIQVVTNVGQLVMVLLFGRHIFTALGLVRTLASFPTGGLMLAATGVLFNPAISTVLLKIFDRLENYLVLNSGSSIILSTFPREQRGRAGLFYSGILKPVVVAMTGLFLLQFSGDRGALFFVLAGVLLLSLPTLHGLSVAYRRALVNNLSSADRSLVTNSIEALGEPENSSVVPELLNFLASNPDPVLQENVLMTAGRIGDPRFIPALLEALKKPNISLKAAAVRALARFDSPEVRDALLKALRETDSARVKASILSALTREKGDVLFLPVLLAALEDPDERVQANAVEALGLMRDRRQLQRLLPFMDCSSPRLWANAVVALGRCAEFRTRVIESVLLRLKDPVVGWQVSALYAVGEMKETSLLPQVYEATHSSDPDVQRNAWITLGKMNDIAAVGPLVDLLTGSAEQARATARALDHLGMQVREAVVAALCMAPSGARAVALNALRTCDVNLLEELERLAAVSGHHAASLFQRAVWQVQSNVVPRDTVPMDALPANLKGVGTANTPVTPQASPRLVGETVLPAVEPPTRRTVL